VELLINTVGQIEVKQSIWEILPKYISLLLDGWNLGEYYLISSGVLLLSYFLFRKYRHYLTSLLIIYIVLFLFYFLSIHYYYKEIEGWINEGHATPQDFDEIFFSSLDTSVFFIFYNIIFIIILFVYKKNKLKGK